MFFCLESFTDSITDRTPGASVAMGFSMNMCLPAATQAAHTHVQDTHNHTQAAHTHPGGGSVPGTYTVPAVGLPNGTYTPTDAPNGAHDYALVYERDLV